MSEEEKLIIDFLKKCKENKDKVIPLLQQSNEILLNYIDKLDLSNKTLNYIASILEKDINIVYGKLDKVFTNHWKYFSRSEENLEKVD